MDLYDGFKMHAAIEAAYHHVISLQQLLINDYEQIIIGQWETNPDRARKTRIIIDDLKKVNDYLHEQAEAADKICDNIAAQVERNQRKAGEQAASDALSEIMDKYPSLKENDNGENSEESERGDGDPR